MILKRLFDHVDIDEQGVITKQDLLHAIQHMMNHNPNDYGEYVLMERAMMSHQDHLKDDRIDFDQFCDLVMQWKEMAPKSLEILYNSWIQDHYISSVQDFGDALDVFPPPTTRTLTPRTSDLAFEQQQVSGRRRRLGHDLSTDDDPKTTTSSLSFDIRN